MLIHNTVWRAIRTSTQGVSAARSPTEKKNKLKKSESESWGERDSLSRASNVRDVAPRKRGFLNSSRDSSLHAASTTIV